MYDHGLRIGQKLAVMMIKRKNFVRKIECPFVIKGVVRDIITGVVSRHGGKYMSLEIGGHVIFSEENDYLMFKMDMDNELEELENRCDVSSILKMMYDPVSKETIHILGEGD